jgi:hypothetical protein
VLPEETNSDCCVEIIPTQNNRRINSGREKLGQSTFIGRMETEQKQKELTLKHKSLSHAEKRFPNVHGLPRALYQQSEMM